MDLSAPIFVALAIAWAAYLIPKAVRQHDAVATRGVMDGLTDRARVLARREPVDARQARFVVTHDRATPAPPGEAFSGPTAEQVRRARTASVRATRRRRTVLVTLLLTTGLLIGLAGFGRVPWWSVAIPLGVIVAWLVVCRVTVRRDQHTWRSLTEPPVVEGETVEVADATASPGAVDASGPADPTGPVNDPAGGLWDPIPVTLPTYVGKPAAARRTVRTIDLDSTGVWTSGRTEADAELARLADESAARSRQGEESLAGDDASRAVGS